MKFLDFIRLSWLLISILALGIANAVDQKSGSPEITWHEYKSVIGYYSIKFPTNPVSRTTHQKRIRPPAAIKQRVIKSTAYDFVIQECKLLSEAYEGYPINMQFSPFYPALGV